MIELRDIYAARRRIRPLVERTPLEYSRSLSKITGTETYVKLEMMRETRAFKIRGAVNFLLAMPEAERSKGVMAASGGSHAMGVAFAANRLGVRSTIVMTERSSENLRAMCREYGAEVIVQGQVYNDSAQIAEGIAKERGMTLIHSYDDPLIVAGQGTIGLEIMEDLPDVEAVVAPVGGGGLLAGVGCALKSVRPGVEVIGVEPENANAMTLSLRENKLVTLENPRSLADRLVVKTPGELTLAMAKRYVDRMVNVTEEEIATHIVMLMEKVGVLAEGAAATASAALFSLKGDLRGRKVVLILTGGNIAPSVLATVLAQAKLL